MRASRLLQLLLALTVRGRVSAAELATELEVSTRTIYRDVDALSAAGVPVHSTRGRAGGFQLLDGYRTRLTGLTPDEAGALFLAGLPGAAADLGLGDVLGATQLKLLAALPADLRDRAARIRDRFHLDAPGWLRKPDTPPCLAVVADAVWTQRRLTARYERSNRTVDERVLEPLGLVLKAGTWYFVARRPDGTARTYRVSRVHSAAVGEQRFDRPPGFVLEDFWTGYQRDYERRIFRDSARVRVSPQGVRLLFLLGTAGARVARAALTAPDASGWAETTLPIESVHHAHHAFLQLGEHLEVLSPPELRELVAESARALAARYHQP